MLEDTAVATGMSFTGAYSAVATAAERYFCQMTYITGLGWMQGTQTVQQRSVRSADQTL